jgi:hypothetical protein
VADELVSVDVEFQIEDDEEGTEGLKFDSEGRILGYGPPILGYETLDPILGGYRLDSCQVEIEGRQFDGFAVSDPLPIVAVAGIVVGGLLLAKAMDLGATALIYRKQGKTPVIRNKFKLKIPKIINLEYSFEVEPKE